MNRLEQRFEATQSVEDGSLRQVEPVLPPLQQPAFDRLMRWRLAEQQIDKHGRAEDPLGDQLLRPGSANRDRLIGTRTAASRALPPNLSPRRFDFDLDLLGVFRPLSNSRRAALLATALLSRKRKEFFDDRCLISACCCSMRRSRSGILGSVSAGLDFQ